MQQRKAKVVWGGTENAAAQEIPAMAMARNSSWPEAEGAPRKKRLALDEKRWNTVVNVMLIAFVMAVPPVIVVFAGGGIAPSVWIAAAKAQLRRGSGDGSFRYARSPPDKLLGGLLSDGLDERSCRSRYESSMYSRNLARRPSPHLIAKLRRHEELQRRCGPNTDAFSRAVQQLRAGKSVDSPECKYLVSISYRGLGNRILAAASAFLYAVLTDRVLLVDPSNEMDELFCEPFPGTTWLLRRDFPLASYTNFSIDTAESYGNMLKNKVLSADVSPPPTVTQLPAFVYLHLDHDYGDEDKMFFCDDDQRLLSNVRWLVMRTDMYTVPGLFLVTAFQEELDMLFPERDAVFHHLARYLCVWGRAVSRNWRPVSEIKMEALTFN